MGNLLLIYRFEYYLKPIELKLENSYEEVIPNNTLQQFEDNINIILDEITPNRKNIESLYENIKGLHLYNSTDDIINAVNNNEIQLKIIITAHAKLEKFRAEDIYIAGSYIDKDADYINDTLPNRYASCYVYYYNNKWLEHYDCYDNYPMQAPYTNSAMSFRSEKCDFDSTIVRYSVGDVVEFYYGFDIYYGVIVIVENTYNGVPFMNYEIYVNNGETDKLFYESDHIHHDNILRIIGFDLSKVDDAIFNNRLDTSSQFTDKYKQEILEYFNKFDYQSKYAK